MNEIIVNPEYKKLVKEVNELKEKLSLLLQEKDELVYHICKNIKTEYMLKIGGLEFKLYKLQCKVLRDKRKIELYQTAINKQEKPNEENIEKQLDKEYKEYKDKLDAMSKNIEDALQRNNLNTMSEEDRLQTKKIYRKIVKALHPDLNLNVTDRMKELLLQATRAYENGDLNSLQLIETLISEIKPTETIELGEFDELNKKKEKYLASQKQIQEQIEKIKNRFPYNQKEILEDEELVEKRKEELNSSIKVWQESYEQIENILAEMRNK